MNLPLELRPLLACTNAIENAIGTVRRVQRNVKRWRNAEMALRWTAAGLLEAQKTFRRLKAYLLAKQTGDTPQFYHVAALADLWLVAQSGRAKTFHFNILRTILEKTALSLQALKLARSC